MDGIVSKEFGDKWRALRIGVACIKQVMASFLCKNHRLGRLIPGPMIGRVLLPRAAVARRQDREVVTCDLPL